MPAALAEVIRNEMVESVHYGHLVLLNAKGEIQLQLGDINLPIFPRSCVKPLQARAMVKAGLNLEPRLLALVTASHSGSETHIEIVHQILKSVGLDESALQCALDKPIGEVERKKWGDAPRTPGHQLGMGVFDQGQTTNAGTDHTPDAGGLFFAQGCAGGQSRIGHGL